MDTLACAIIFCIGAAKLLLSIPVGFALGLHPIEIFLAASLGSIVGIALIVFLGERVRASVLNRYGKNTVNWRYGRARRIWEKYGIKGIGLIGPLFPGAPLAAAIGVALGAPRYKLFAWFTAGVLIWSALIVALLYLGIMGISAFIQPQ